LKRIGSWLCNCGGIEKIILQGYSKGCFVSLGFDCHIEVIPVKREGLKGLFLEEFNSWLDWD
jgi:hypothetical protein